MRLIIINYLTDENFWEVLLRSRLRLFSSLSFICWPIGACSSTLCLVWFYSFYLSEKWYI